MKANPNAEIAVIVATAGIVRPAAPVAAQDSAAAPVRRARKARVVDPSAAVDPVDPVPLAVRVAKALTPEHVVVTVFCDTGERYLTTDLFRGEEI